MGRRGPGLIGTMARTAVIAGTATATVNAVNNKGASKQAAQQQQAAAAQQQASAQQLAAEQQQAAAQQLAVQQAQIEALQAQQIQAQLAAQQVAAPAAPTGLTPEKIAQLQQLADLQKAGILTEEEFATQKARILNS